MKPLHGLKVLDLTQRLPGPLGGMLLADLGAEVIKVEDLHYQDAFLDPKLGSIDDGFVQWYGELNGKKHLLRLEFGSTEAIEKLKQSVESADIILYSLPDKIAHQLQLRLEDLISLNKPLAIIALGASDKHKVAMHELNALAEAGFLNLHVSGEQVSPLAPPFLPVAGIAFGQQIALTALALHRQAQQLGKPTISKLFLYEEMMKVYRPFWTDKLRAENRTKFLHNGKYPCYSLYRTKDGNWIAVAAVEEKFWREFLGLFSIALGPMDRFSTDSAVFHKVAQSIAHRSTAEIEDLLKNKDICVSLIRSSL